MFVEFSAIAWYRIVQQEIMAKYRSFRGDNSQERGRYDQRHHACMDLDYANDHRRAQSSSESGTPPRAADHICGLGHYFNDAEQPRGTRRRLSYIPPYRRRWQSPNPKFRALYRGLNAVVQYCRMDPRCLCHLVRWSWANRLARYSSRLTHGHF